jgi:hypothetical protein
MKLPSAGSRLVPSTEAQSTPAKATTISVAGVKPAGLVVTPGFRFIVAIKAGKAPDVTVP